jgi:predicted nucleotidyltransferase
VGGFVSGDYGSDIDIAVVHPDAIAIQNPYEDLNYKSLPEIP